MTFARVKPHANQISVLINRLTVVAFWAWYTFPPLVRTPSTRGSHTDRPELTYHLQLTHTIKANLHLTPTEVANSNIVSLCAT